MPLIYDPSIGLHSASMIISSFPLVSHHFTIFHIIIIIFMFRSAIIIQLATTAVSEWFFMQLFIEFFRPLGGRELLPHGIMPREMRNWSIIFASLEWSDFYCSYGFSSFACFCMWLSFTTRNGKIISRMCFNRGNTRNFLLSSSRYI